MCGRYTLTADRETVMTRFGLDEAEIDLTPRYNIAPSQPVGIITADRPTVLTPARWGLIPSWADDPSIANRLINARAETIAEKPSFKKLFHTRRCLVPADGFYEWAKQPDGMKIPMRVTLKSGGVMALAGLWDEWVSPEGERRRTVTIITTEPNELIASLHHRMAVILSPEAEKIWLAGADPAALLALLKPFPAELMTAYEVSKRVNTVTCDEPSLIEPVVPQPRQASLF